MKTLRARTCQVNNRRQNGVGLIEVLIALFVLAFGSLAISNMHTDSLIGLKVSSNHLKINSISNEIAEHLKAMPEAANAGDYDTVYSDAAAASGVPAGQATLINAWKQLTAQSLPSGQLNIACAANLCSLSLRWRESLSDGIDTQTYNVRIPI